MLANTYINPEVTEIREDGLRYASRATPVQNFVVANNLRRSCFLCGCHIPRSNGTFRRLIGVSRFVCVKC